MSFQGLPCWYELTTTDPAASQRFYGALLGWAFCDSGMPGMDYRLAQAEGALVAGLAAAAPGTPEGWLVYFAVERVDDSCAQIAGLGGTVLVPPTDIPGTGRFAVATDPQGAAFGLLQPLDDHAGGAFDQAKAGHGNWHELTVPDPVAALAFYGAVLGWDEAEAMDMGAMGTYHIIGCQGQQIGGIMRTPAPEVPPMWAPYFGHPSIKAGMDQIAALGGKTFMGPMEVPGGAFVCMAFDPRGACFALVGGA